MNQVSEQTYTDAIHPFDVKSWGGDQHATWRTRYEPIRTLREGESCDFVVTGDVEAAGIRSSAYGALPGQVTCERIAPDLVRVTRLSEREIISREELDRLARRVPCPSCFVEIGHCLDSRGSKQNYTHAARRHEAEKRRG